MVMYGNSGILCKKMISYQQQCHQECLLLCGINYISMCLYQGCSTPTCPKQSLQGIRLYLANPPPFLVSYSVYLHQLAREHVSNINTIDMSVCTSKSLSDYQICSVQCIDGITEHYNIYFFLPPQQILLIDLREHQMAVQEKIVVFSQPREQE